MDEKIITVFGKNYRVVREERTNQCDGCVNEEDCSRCDSFEQAFGGNCLGFIFKETTQSKVYHTHIGIIPLVNHNTMRLNALMDTLQRYAEAGSPTKVQWVQEVKSLIEYERNLTREALDKVPFNL